VLADRVLVFDHEKKHTYMLCMVPGTSSADAGKQGEQWMQETEAALSSLGPLPRLVPVEGPAPVFEFRHHKQAYLDLIGVCKRKIRDGESYELCLTNQMFCPAAPPPLALYRQYRKINPAPYGAFVALSLLSPTFANPCLPAPADVAIVCSSPERFIQVTKELEVESKPIKGTIGRGVTPEEDETRKEELATNQKDFSENLMIVDLIRNDLGKVCKMGSVHVPKLMHVESFATVHQLVTTVRGTLRPHATSADVLRQCFPPGSMTGAPKLRSTEILEVLESQKRGVYSGCLGFLSCTGAADLNVVIRTAVCSGNGLSIGTGGAITHLSNDEDEHDEMLLKARALTKAIHTAMGAEAQG
jgi:para-aminobenzoate synthetase